MPLNEKYRIRDLVQYLYDYFTVGPPQCIIFAADYI